MNLQDKDQIVNYVIVFFAIAIIAIYGIHIFSTWGSAARPTPLGEDFAIFWAASALSLAGEPEAAYDASRLQDVQRAATGKTTPKGCGWYYPPIFLLLMLPLSLLPYAAALTVWLGGTLSGYLLVLQRLAPSRLTVWLALAFPGTFWNFLYGQNGFFSAALLGGGLLLLNTSPVWAGLLLGAMFYKPQLAVLIPVALVAGRCWKALLATITTAAVLTLISSLVLGNGVWSQFFSHLAIHKKLFESGNLIMFEFVPTTLSAALLAGCNPATGYILQAVIMLFVTAAVFMVWRQGGATPISASVLVLGILLFSHFYCLYDYTLLALPLAWLGWEGYCKDWLPVEKIILILAWFMPIIKLLTSAKIQVGPLILGMLFLLALRRHYLGCRVA